MCEHHPLQYWLESINLPQYYLNFSEAGLISQDQCVSLDEATLGDIGISLPGHQRRILSHLPTKDSGYWHGDMEAAPNLPPKKKSVRDSFMYKDSSSSIYGNVPMKSSQSSDTGSTSSTTSTTSSSSLNVQKSGDVTSSQTPQKLSPRPVPRPRSRQPQSPMSPSTPEGDRPKPAPRPVPRPRKLTAETGPTTHKGSSDSLHSSSSHDETQGMPEQREVVTEPDINARVTEQNEYDYVPKDFASSEHDNNEPQGRQFSVSAMNQTIEQNSAADDSLRYSRELALTLTGACVDETVTDPDLEIYENVTEFQATSDTTTANQDMDKQGEYEDTFNSDYANIEGSSMTKSNMTQIPNTTGIGLDQVDLRTKDSDAKQRPVTDEMSDIYEPIWTDNKQGACNAPSGVRSSNLMQFSPALSRDAASVQASRMSTFGKERPKTEFDLPPPEFPPPPLPEQSSGAQKLPENFDEFDPLSMKMPSIPPRPSNYVAPRFKPYANLDFHGKAGSSTLPGSDVNMEPDELSAPKPIGQETEDDPFSQHDPFGDFTPDDDDFTVESFPPKSCNAKDADNNNTFVNPATGSSFTSRQSDIYEVAKDNTQDFDPFGLNEHATSLARSESSTSGGSVYRLSEVPPAPKWSETVYDPGNWFQPNNTERVYSLAEQINEDASSDGSLEDISNQGPNNDHTDGMSPVDIVPINSLPTVRRKKERSGYLYKQGGVKQNRGWRKRWVIFDGKTLRYYSNAKDQVSKRIVPLSCMTNVEMDVRNSLESHASLKQALTHARPLSRIITSGELFEKSRKSSLSLLNGANPNNCRQFKFLLHCTNRTFLFATDNLDDCKFWSNTLMEAILTNKRSSVDAAPGGDMADPDMENWIRINKNRVKFYVALKQHKLAYYQNYDDYKMASPLHEIEMKLSGIKELDRTRLQLHTHYSVFILHFETSSDASNWKIAIEEAITNALGDNTIVEQVRENPANRQCGDCGAPDPHWASMNLGMVLCLRCAGIHRGFDHKLSKIRSLRMDTKIWNSSLIEMFKGIGNENANKYWLTRLPADSGIAHDASAVERKQFIHNKYKDQLYSNKHPYAGDRIRLNESLLSAAQTDDVLVSYQILMSGAEVLYHKLDQPETTAFELAKQSHQRLQMELLLQNGGDRSRNFLPGSDQEASLEAKMRSEVQKQGVLYKTGSNMKDFLKRHCVLEHGHMSYYVSEDARVEKDRIDNESILCIHAVLNERQPACFEISTKKSNRIYLFSAGTDEERSQWMSAIAQIFCPVSKMEMMKHAEFTLAGYTWLKTGFNMEWQRSWFVLESRTLIFMDKEEMEREYDSIDLRKVASITKIVQSMTPCQSCLEQGWVFGVKTGDRDMNIYFQADLTRDTDRMFAAIEQASKHGGDMLEDQVLTNDDIPVTVYECINFIQQYGLKMHGVYRKSEQESKIKNVLQKFQEDARSVVLPIEENAVYTVSNVLKRFLRNLKDPLLTKQFYPRWLKIAEETDHNTKLQWYKYLLQQLPRINYLTLRFFVIHLYKISEHEKVNQMSIENLAISLGPSLMQYVNDDNAMKGFASKTHLEIKVLSDIITYHRWLFDVSDTDDGDEKMKKAMDRLQAINEQNSQMEQEVNDLMITVHHLSPEGNSDMVRIRKSSTVTSVIQDMCCKFKLNPTHYALYEIVKKDFERPLFGEMKVWSVVEEWSNWSADYASGACLCLKSTEAKNAIENAYDPSRSCFGELKYCEKKKFDKRTFEFAQAKLSFYKDARNVNHPMSSWNVEDINIYRGCDPKRSPPFKYCFTFQPHGDKMGEKDLFGKTVSFPSEQDLLGWLAAMYKVQSTTGFS